MDSGDNPSNQAYDAGSWSGSPHAASQTFPPFSYAPLDQTEQNKDPHFQAPFPSPPTDSTLCAQPPPPKMERLHPVVYDNSSPSSDIYYPRVRYIFDDDDPDLLSSALSTQHRLLESEWSSNEPLASTKQDRAILLDFSPSSNGRSYEISRATSLSADWVVTGTRLGHMEMGSSPSGAENESQEDEPWMLAIEGVNMLAGAEVRVQGTRTTSNSTLPHPSDEGGKSSLSKERNEAQFEDYNTLIRGFNMRMGLLKKVTLNSDKQNFPFSGNIEQDDVILLPEDNSRQAD